MAPPRSNVSQPGRALTALFIAIAALTGLMFWQGQTTPKLALDLAGGTSVTLTAVTGKGKTPPGSLMTQAVSIMRNRVNGLGVSEAEVAKQGTNVIVVQVPGQGQSRVVGLIGTTAKLQFRQVFAETSPGPVAAQTPTPTPSPGASQSPSAKPSASASASASASPSSSARSRALSQALTAPTPGPSAAASPAPGSTASPAPASPAPASPAPSAATGTPEQQAALALFQKADCSKKGTKLAGANDDKRQWVAACDQDGQAKYLLGPVRVQGEQVASAIAQPPNVQQGEVAWSVSLTFKKQGSNEFYNVTKDAYAAYQKDSTSPERQVSIVLDGQVVSAPEITRGAIGGSAQIDGPPDSFTQQYATDLANVLNYGALPLEFKQSAIEAVSPTLGRDQLTAGLIAGAIGLGLVVLYCLMYYRGLGFVAIFSLAIAGLITYLSVVLLGKFIDFRLSLAGIAGLIVAIGITADSFVVYFERLRDEVREGRSLRSAIERGWERARRTVLVADAVSFLAALVLYIVSIGTVRGFAFTLGLTTLIDVVVVFLFTKPMVTGLSRLGFFSRGHRLSGLDPHRLGAKPATRGTGPTMPKEA